MSGEVHNIIAALLPHKIPIDQVAPHPDNARIGDVDFVASSLQRHGQYRVAIVDDTDLLALGNHMWRAAKQLGWTHIAAIRPGLDQAAARDLRVTDNRAHDRGHYDPTALLRELDEIVAAAADHAEGNLEQITLASVGYDDQTLTDLRRLTDPEPDTEPGRDTQPGDAPAAPRTKSGDMYSLGDHRLLCGDSTVAADVERLMDGALADAMWTDPPYGVSYVGKTKDAMTLANDDRGGLEALLTGAFGLASKVLRRGSPLWIAHPPGAQSVTFGRCFLAEGWRLHETLVWVKDTMVLGHSDYHLKHESLLYGYTPCKGRRGRGGQGWYGNDSQVSVLEFNRPKVSPDHPTSKPIDLIEHCLRNSTRPGESLYEPFAGSGSTLIAAENLGRTAYLMELDPGYCDVIVDRWERHTGQTAKQETPHK